MHPPIAVFGIHNSTVTLVVDLVILFLVVIWLALIYWTYADARRRIDDPMLVGCATAASLFPYVGSIIYMIVRPPEYLDDVADRELSIRASEAQLTQSGQEPCPHCERPVQSDFLRCPHCLRKLREACGGCGKPLNSDWRICPYCETEVPGVTPPRRRRRREGPAQGGGQAPQAGQGGQQGATPTNRQGGNRGSQGSPERPAQGASVR
ncbi:MAG: zinc ribbon domain-containing protein [Solirubrobacterales bacterium]|nr:zinc ribbon domain-containing protein [Solirubrobacterales bacterium]